MLALHSWSRYSRFVLTSSKDWNVIVWDLLSDADPVQRHTTLRFDAPVISAYFHPRNSHIILALLGSGEAYLVDLRKENRGQVELCEVQEESDDEGEVQGNRQRCVIFSPRNHSMLIRIQPMHRAAMTVARFDPTGKHIFVGTSSGSVLVFNTRTKSVSTPSLSIPPPSSHYALDGCPPQNTLSGLPPLPRLRQIRSKALHQLLRPNPSPIQSPDLSPTQRRPRIYRTRARTHPPLQRSHQ